MYEISRRIQFCAGHRVYKHESKCNNMHGHNYVLYVYAKPYDGLDLLGRVIDFSVLKEKVGGWIEEHWDHGFILFDEDEELFPMLCYGRKGEPAHIKTKHYTMPRNPTAENMASELLHVICPKLFAKTDVYIYKVELHETENCCAIVQMSDVQQKLLNIHETERRRKDAKMAEKDIH